MTKETFEKLPETIRRNLEDIRNARRNNIVDASAAREKAYWYTKGLRDGGLITERERQILFIYTTV